MNFKQWLKQQNGCHQSLYGNDILKRDEWIMEEAWLACQEQILKLLEQNTELESISHNGKKVYKIYGNVIDKIRKL